MPKTTQDVIEAERQLGHPRTVLQYLRIFITGFFMGSADIVPGVSGGTIAFIMGIYDTLIDAIKSFNLDALRLVLARKIGAFIDHVSLRFLITLGIGILAAVFTLAHVLEGLLETQPTYVFAWFGGLVLASIIAVAPKIGWSPLTVIVLIVGAVFAFWLTGLGGLGTGAEPEAAGAASYDLLTLFVSGAIAIVAMILPGISGSFILVLLGQYRTVLSFVTERNFFPLIVFALGCVIGIMLFSRVLSYLLHHYRSITLAALVGFMLGSLRKVWIEAAAGVDTMTAAGAAPSLLMVIVLIVFGFAIVTVLDHLSSGGNPIVRLFVRPRK
ncbi:MAG: hypothetical protein AELANPGJ_02519 [Anaerolineae bacterium]|jgi:putative membrane protein|nr:hypothetical protein [Anaerolineae bacterium]MEB2365599.1 DUF368 domain-containing protein [Chloroflexota bacterium]OQY84949.1 MAG: hypothetical protein B6D42_04230 [Anaerolineae bacterium UTCFX5]GIK28762.1 MAG: DUF368 domain-containing protein [Chloroflexota bacterium]